MAACLAIFGSSASATTYVKFYTDAGNTHGYGNAGDVFSGPGTLYAAMTSGSGTYVPVSCPDTGSCSQDNIQTTLSFSGLGLTVSANSGMKAWDDLAPNFGGIGVGTGSSGADTEDQINGTNVLILTFASQIHLTGVATLADGAHTDFGPGDPSLATSSALYLTSGFMVDDGDGTGFHFVTFADANKNLLNLTGTTFKFETNANNNPWFYVSGLAYDSCAAQCAPGQTPLPAALPLFASGLGAMGVLGWRRKRKAARAA